MYWYQVSVEFRTISPFKNYILDTLKVLNFVRCQLRFSIQIQVTVLIRKSEL